MHIVWACMNWLLNICTFCQKADICTNGWEDWRRYSSKLFTEPDVSAMSWYLRWGNHPWHHADTPSVGNVSRTMTCPTRISITWSVPLCREVTKLSANRVEDFLTNVTVNALVDDYHAKCGGVNAILEMHPKCTACKRQEEAVSFCKSCNSYFCGQCLTSHQNLSVMFEAHEIVSVQDIINGKVSIGHLSEKCDIHKQENKDMFCEDCKVPRLSQVRDRRSSISQKSRIRLTSNRSYGLR